MNRDLFVIVLCVVLWCGVGNRLTPPKQAAPMSAVELIIFRPPCQLMSMNDRLHWRVKAQRTDWWRQAAWAAARPTKPMPPCTVHIQLPVRDKRRRDPHNYFQTVKPIIDGLVDAKVWPDDTPEWVTTVEPTLSTESRNVVVRLVPR